MPPDGYHGLSLELGRFKIPIFECGNKLGFRFEFLTALKAIRRRKRLINAQLKFKILEVWKMNQFCESISINKGSNLYLTSCELQLVIVQRLTSYMAIRYIYNKANSLL